MMIAAVALLFALLGFGGGVWLADFLTSARRLTLEQERLELLRGAERVAVCFAVASVAQPDKAGRADVDRALTDAVNDLDASAARIRETHGIP